MNLVGKTGSPGVIRDKTGKSNIFRQIFRPGCTGSQGSRSKQTLSEMKISYKRIAMQQYKLKRGFKPDIERIYSVMQECFPGEIAREGDVLETAYGAMAKITVSIENKKLFVDTASNPSMLDDETILQTNRIFRDFLFKATGYTGKERLKQAKKEVSGK